MMTAPPTLELDDIQGLVIRPYGMDFARLFFLTVTSPAAAGTWISAVVPEVTSATPWDTKPASCLNLAVTIHGLQVLGVPPGSLASFPDDFRSGIAQRAALLGDTGSSDPAGWQPGLNDTQSDILVFLFAQTAAERDAQTLRLRATMQHYGGVIERVVQDADDLPGGVEHFGYVDGISQPTLAGSGIEPPTGSLPAIAPGEIVLGYPDETQRPSPMPSPPVLGMNGTYLVFRKLRQDVAGFRTFLATCVTTLSADSHGQDIDADWVAAKLMGRWRSGAPLVLAPQHDDPNLAGDAQRNNGFLYQAADPDGLLCPLGAHIRRASPRDTLVDASRHHLIRRGIPYGPPLPAGASDDGIDRGLIFLAINASIERQFEFVQRVWLNGSRFDNLQDDKDVIVGDNDGTASFTIPRKPFRWRIHGVPRFVTVQGGGYFLLPGIRSLRWIATSATGTERSLQET